MAATLLMHGSLGPGEEENWFFDNMPPGKVRSFNAYPYYPEQQLPPGSRGTYPVPPNIVTAVEITHIYYLLKVQSGSMQLNLTIRNTSPDPGVSTEFDVYMTEV